MKILTFSSLYPNNADPRHGIFVARRLAELVSRTDVRSDVVAPVPWFPLRSPAFGSYAAHARVERFESRNGMATYHPRYPVIPKFGMSLAAPLMTQALRRPMRRLLAAHGPFDLIDAHYFYPDGVAAAALARHFNLPCVITARGSDINLIARYRSPRRQIRRAAASAAAIVAVSEALAAEMCDIGIEPEKVTTIRNGVDLEFFSPGDAAHARRSLDLPGPVVLSVGALKTAKGHDVAIRFLRSVEDLGLVVIGSGPQDRALRKLARELGVADRVRFTGSIEPAELRDYYRAAEALILMSQREGMPNVVLESLACGTPVIASRVGGIPEVLGSSSAGLMVDPISASGLAAAWRQLRVQRASRSQVRRHAEQFGWPESIDRLESLLKRCASGEYRGMKAQVTA